jgi:hypothetical protein
MFLLLLDLVFNDLHIIELFLIPVKGTLRDYKLQIIDYECPRKA